MHTRGRPSQDLSGLRFSKLMVTTETYFKADSKSRRQRYWVCTCDSGATKAIRANSLISGHSKSCSAVKHRQVRFLDLIRHQFGNGQILVIAYAGPGLDVNTGKHYRLWRCKCACGKVFVIRANSLRQCKTRSCGCLRANKGRARFRALHFIERKMGKDAIADIEQLSAFAHVDHIFGVALSASKQMNESNGESR
jgi:hypothetical protein